MDIASWSLGYNETRWSSFGVRKATDAESSSEVSNPEMVFIRLWGRQVNVFDREAALALPLTRCQRPLCFLRCNPRPPLSALALLWTWCPLGLSGDLLDQ